MDENIIVSPIYVILNSVFSTYNLNLMSNPSASSKHNFCFEKNGYIKKYNKQKTKNPKKPGERKLKSLEDRTIKTIELQDM